MERISDVACSLSGSQGKSAGHSKRARLNGEVASDESGAKFEIGALEGRLSRPRAVTSAREFQLPFTLRGVELFADPVLEGK